MADTPIKVFISYSREDQEFALRLQASLEERGVTTWIDTKGIEGGDDWVKRITKAIDDSQFIVIILSPTSVKSEWIDREIVYAQGLKKEIIPLMWRNTDVPFRIGELHYVDIEKDYKHGLKELLFKILPTPHLKQTTKSSQGNQEAPSVYIEPTRPYVPKLVEPRPTSLAPEPDINALYVEGVGAYHKGDLERAEVLLQRVVERDTPYRPGWDMSDEFQSVRDRNFYAYDDAVAKLQDVQRRIHKGRVKHLEESAIKAENTGEHTQAINFWQALLNLDSSHKQARSALVADLRNRAQQAHQLGNLQAEIDNWQGILELESNDAQARQSLLNIYRGNAEKAYLMGHWEEEIKMWQEVLKLDTSKKYKKRIEVAWQNLQMVNFYKNAQQFLQQGNLRAAKDQLQLVWKSAPYYGDPAGIASKVDTLAPPTIQEEEAEQERAAKAHEQMRQEEEFARESARQSAAEAKRKVDEHERRELEELERKEMALAARNKLWKMVIQVCLIGAAGGASIGASVGCISAFSRVSLPIALFLTAFLGFVGWVILVTITDAEPDVKRITGLFGAEIGTYIGAMCIIAVNQTNFAAKPFITIAIAQVIGTLIVSIFTALVTYQYSNRKLQRQ